LLQGQHFCVKKALNSIHKRSSNMSVISVTKQVDLQHLITKFIPTENVLMEKWKHVLLVEMEDGKANMTTIHSFSSACAQLKSLLGRTVENACKEILKRLL
jgi:prephenate dehydratase